MGYVYTPRWSYGTLDVHGDTCTCPFCEGSGGEAEADRDEDGYVNRSWSQCQYCVGEGALDKSSTFKAIRECTSPGDKDRKRLFQIVRALS